MSTYHHHLNNSTTYTLYGVIMHLLKVASPTSLSQQPSYTLSLKIWQQNSIIRDDIWKQKKAPLRPVACNLSVGRFSVNSVFWVSEGFFMLHLLTFVQIIPSWIKSSRFVLCSTKYITLSKTWYIKSRWKKYSLFYLQ